MYRIITATSEAYNYQLLLKRLWEIPLIYSPNKEIVYRDLRRYTYLEFYHRLKKVANMLESVGVGPGDVVGVADWDTTRFLELFFCVPMKGSIIHTINIRLSPEQILYTINHAEDKVLIVNEEFKPIVEKIKSKFETVEKIIYMSDNEEKSEYDNLVSKASDDYEFPDFDENTQATLFYTTGTTGDPKGVYFSHRQLMLHTFSVAIALSAYETHGRFKSNDVYMPITPLFHVHAWGVPFIATLLGVKQVYPGRYEPEMLLSLIERERVTISHCVPTILHMLLNHPKSKEVDLSEWKVIIGGSALSKGLCKEAMDVGIDIYTGYGMSETCPVLTLAYLKPNMLDYDLDKQIDIRTKTGLPIPMVDVRLMDENGNFVPHDGKSTGEIVVRTPWLTQGYFKNEKGSKELWRYGWLHTGDVGYIDEEGYLKITDRVKDVIKSGGEWISSLTLEDIISQHEAVSESAAVGKPDKEWGERPVIFVVLKDEYKGKVSKESLIEFFYKYVEQGIIPKYGIPDDIIFVDSLPKTSVGKLDKKELRKRLN